MRISIEVGLLINQIEIYDQVHFARHPRMGEKHSAEATALGREFFAELDGIDSFGETFPFEEIAMLREEFGLED